MLQRPRPINLPKRRAYRPSLFSLARLDPSDWLSFAATADHLGPQTLSNINRKPAIAIIRSADFGCGTHFEAKSFLFSFGLFLRCSPVDSVPQLLASSCMSCCFTYSHLTLFQTPTTIIELRQRGWTPEGLVLKCPDLYFILCSTFWFHFLCPRPLSHRRLICASLFPVQ